MEQITEIARAKLNLTLDITGESHGFHLLDMVVCTVDVFDEVIVSPRGDGAVTCYMDGVLQGMNNSAVKAAELVRNTFKTNGFDVIIKKGIPFAGGLGGSSADGAAVVRAAVKILDIPERKITPEWLLNIGCDVPCMYFDGLKRVRGIGEKLDFIDIEMPYKVAFISGSGVDTATAYRTFDEMKLKGSNNTERLINDINKRGFDVADYVGNDLYPAAARLNTDVKNSRERLSAAGARAVNMSGSGSTVYGLFASLPQDFIATSFVK